MQRLFDRVLGGDQFADDPPVCIDIGASGKLPAEWRQLARHSVCVAFDADTREFQTEDSVHGGWRRLLKLNRLVTDGSGGELKFYLTKSPFCSSSLAPDNAALEPWAFNELFEVERETVLPAISLRTALADLGISRIDWFKADTQGTDLRLFASLPEHLIERTIVADFEPGIIDAYKSEDKLSALLSFMDSRPFFVSDMRLSGSQRISAKAIARLGSFDRIALGSVLKTSPGWTEISYVNTFTRTDYTSRDLLLGWVCSTIKKQDGHALWIAGLGVEQFGDSIFDECAHASVARMRKRYPKFAAALARKTISRIVHWR